MSIARDRILAFEIRRAPEMQVLLAKHGGRADFVSTFSEAPLEANGPRQHYMRAVLDHCAATVTPAINQDSSLLAPMASANALIVRAPNAPAVDTGASVPVLRIDF